MEAIGGIVSLDDVPVGTSPSEETQVRSVAPTAHPPQETHAWTTFTDRRAGLPQGGAGTMELSGPPVTSVDDALAMAGVGAGVGPAGALAGFDVGPRDPMGGVESDFFAGMVRSRHTCWPSLDTSPVAGAPLSPRPYPTEGPLARLGRHLGRLW
jgi:hypothetical protein